MVDDSQHRSQSKILGPILAWIVACGLIDVITPGVLDASREPELPGLFTGAVGGQAAVLGIWAVLGPGRWLVRWPSCLLVTMGFWCVLLLGTALTGLHGPPVHEVFAATLMLPLVLLAVQLPLWLLRLATGWRLVAGGEQAAASPTGSRQFRLQHMLAATAVVAAALGLAGAGLSIADGPDTKVDASEWLPLMLFCLFVSVWSAFSTLPCLWAALVVRNRVTGAVAIAIYAVLMSLLAVVVISAIAGGLPATEGMRVFVPFHVGLALVLLGSLYIARRHGCVLLRPRRVQRPATPSGSSPFDDSSDPLLPPLP